MSNKQFYVHGSHYRKDGTIDTCYTVGVEHKISEMPHHKAGLSFTATGYGSRIPTRHMVKFNGKWRRVYVRCYANAGTTYIGKLSQYGERLIIQEYN